MLRLLLGGPLWLAAKVAEAADQQILDPSRVEAELLRLEARLDAGELDEAVFEQQEAELLAELKAIRAALAERAA